MTIQYTPRGVCSRSFTIQVEDGLIQSVQVVGGCSGNPVSYTHLTLPTTERV